jgi:DNA-binding PadR family transcriptional regulator
MRSAGAQLGRFTDAGLLILASLADGPKHGYAMITDIGRFSGTVLEPGTLYGALARLEKAGWIQAQPAEDRRRPYRLTLAGEQALRSQLDTMTRVVAAAAARLAPA